MKNKANVGNGWARKTEQREAKIKVYDIAMLGAVMNTIVTII